MVLRKGLPHSYASLRFSCLPALQHHAEESQGCGSSMGRSLWNYTLWKAGTTLHSSVNPLDAGAAVVWGDEVGGENKGRPEANTLRQRSTSRRRGNGRRSLSRTSVFWFCSRSLTGSGIQCICHCVRRQSEKETRKLVCLGFQLVFISSSLKLAKLGNPWPPAPTSIHTQLSIMTKTVMKNQASPVGTQCLPASSDSFSANLTF